MSKDIDHLSRTMPPAPDESHRCGRCGVSYPTITVDDAVRAVRAVPDELAGVLHGSPPPPLRQRPEPTTWSVLEYLCHLRDVYATYTIRLHRARTELRPVLEPMLNDLRARRFRYNALDPDPVLAELGYNVAGLLDEVARFTVDDWARQVVSPPGAGRSARWLLRQVMHEGVHHGHDIVEIIARLHTSD